MNALTSLVKYRHIAVPRLDVPTTELEPKTELEPCGRVDYDLVNVATMERIPGSCKAYVCAVCGPKKLWLLEMALVASKPQRFVMLSWAPEDSKRRRDHVANLHRSLRKDGYRSEMAWTWEDNPTPKAAESTKTKASDVHIHGLQKGDFIPQAVLQKKWGDRYCYIEKIDSVSEGVERYMLKAQAAAVRTAGYALKQTGERARPVNITRNYFDGRKLGDVKSDVKQLLFNSFDEPTGSWVRVPKCS